MKELYEEFSLTENGTLKQMTEEQQLYSDYLLVRYNGTQEQGIEVLNRIIQKYPKILNYLLNRADTCFGTHSVYIIKIRVNGIICLKAGYTKNSIVDRLKEKRYQSVELLEIYREEFFQAKGAKDFEKKLKDLTKKHFFKNDFTFPGKGEVRFLDSLDEMLNFYDELAPQYKDIIGLKSPN
jgi:hypothetical protein